MKTTSIPRQLMLLTAVLAVAVVIASTMAYFMITGAYQESSAATAAGAAELTRSYKVLEEVAAVQDAVQRLVRIKDPDKLEQAIAEIGAKRKLILELATSAGERGATIRAGYEEAIVAEGQIIDAVLKGDLGTANERFMGSASPKYEAVKDAVRVFFGVAQQSTAAAMAANEARARAQVMIRLAIANVAMLGLIVYLWVWRRRVTAALAQLSTTLLESGGQLADTSAQVTASSQSVSDGVNRQAAALEETSASLEEIGATASQNAGHAQQAKDLAGETRNAAETGHHDMREMMEAMDAIKAASGAIAGIIKTIDQIAFQTNLLALNAAVEAARAGQAGQGFAVVADEVRALAQRSATAARETAVSVEEVIARSDRGVEVSGKVARSFEDIVARTRRVDGLVAEIAAASDQQRIGIEQVSVTMADMEKVTQAGAATAEETAATVLELNAQAEALRGVVAELQVLAGEQAAVEHATHQPAGPQFASPFSPRRAA
jgi:methyl-accepting chemotaxis protein